VEVVAGGGGDQAVVVVVVVAMATVKVMYTNGNTFLPPIPPSPPLNRDTKGRGTDVKEGVNLSFMTYRRRIESGVSRSRSAKERRKMLVIPRGIPVSLV